MARRKAFTKKRRASFLEKLEKSGNVSAASREAGVNRQYMYERRADDPEFAAAWDAAEQTFLDAAASEEARRALMGDVRTRRRTSTIRFADGSTKTEEITEEVLVKSDRLLAHMLDRRHPEFRAAAAKRELSGPGGRAIPLQQIPEDATEHEAANAYLALVTPQ